MSIQKWLDLQATPLSELADEELGKFILFTWSELAGKAQAQGTYQALVAEKVSRENKKNNSS